MRNPGPLPESLGLRFAVADALNAGATPGRLRRSDLDAPFHAVRVRPIASDLSDFDPFTRQVTERRIQAYHYAPRLRADQVLSHESAVAVLGGPLPLVFTPRSDTDGAPPDPMDGQHLDVHVSTIGDGPLVRAKGVRGHRAAPDATTVSRVRDFMIVSPATSWAQLAHLRLPDLVALGDYYCRQWRPGPGRPDVGRAPLTTIDQLRSTIASFRWSGIRRLREAVELVREDSWSPRESQLRCHLVLAGLPEPLLNHDVYEDGRFLGCVDLAYPDRKIAIEYHGVLHSGQYAADVERIAGLRAAGWIVIEVTSALFAHPEQIIARVRAALRA
ncbi:hypothetical protein WDU99_06055 [Microbacterium sp. Mu-80]|uniref:DUF559 domain-containing protein n=1 Tax=Microbacterium bandirmense TaxID=3122050 RepID=A0ABU8L978_9MICO